MMRRHRALLAIYLAAAAVWGLSWIFPSAVDWYRLFLFPLGTNTLARFLSLFPCSVGELLVIAGLLLLAGFAVVGLFGIFLRGEILKRKMRKAARIYLEVICWVLAWVAVTEVLNCFVLYHAATVEEEYYPDAEVGEDSLTELYGMLVSNANRLSEEMERDEDGGVLYSGDLYGECKAAMRALGEDYPYLKGYYPDPKPILHSDFMSQQYLTGIYFPFTLEANYNQAMYVMNRPATICHELSHLKGVIREDEANYFGFLACIGSEDPYIAYSGYLSVLPYVSRDVRETVGAEVRKGLEQPSELVQRDAVFLTEEAWERVEENAVIATETVNQATDAFLEGNLKTNGVEEGMKSYSQVVRLLLAWYCL